MLAMEVHITISGNLMSKKHWSIIRWKVAMSWLIIDQVDKLFGGRVLSHISTALPTHREGRLNPAVFPSFSLFVCGMFWPAMFPMKDLFLKLACFSQVQHFNLLIHYCTLIAKYYSGKDICSLLLKCYWPTITDCQYFSNDGSFLPDK